RHSEIKELRDLNEEDPMEIEASKYELAYIKLDGKIGCMVNGAGLAMATMDMLQKKKYQLHLKLFYQIKMLKEF
ncbi:MAG: ADP-forming succinate--CoA ligase subunit beta, partial [Pseudomonadota bacterium]